MCIRDRQKDCAFAWGKEQQKAFDEIKEKSTTQPVLALFDPNARTKVHTDTSQEGIGAILLQEQADGSLRPVMYYSQTTTKDEKYHAYELEMLAVVKALQKFRVYLYGKKFKIVTDCAAVCYMFTKRDLTPRIGRWWLVVQEYDFEIEYRPGTKMRHVDALSRNAINVRTISISEDGWIQRGQDTDPKIVNIKEELCTAPESKLRTMYSSGTFYTARRINDRTITAILLVSPHAQVCEEFCTTMFTVPLQ